MKKEINKFLYFYRFLATVDVYRYNSSSDFKQWVSAYAGDAPEGEITTNIQIIMSYSASINGVTPNVLDY